MVARPPSGRPTSAPGARRSGGGARASSSSNAYLGAGGDGGAGSSSGWNGTGKSSLGFSHTATSSAAVPNPNKIQLRESKVLSGRERLTDVETLEDLYFNTRKDLRKLETICEALQTEIHELEAVEYQKDKQLYDLLLTAKTIGHWEKDIHNVRSDLELLSEAKKKTSELRELVEERELAITSITKQLKQSRAAQLEQEVAKMQELVKTTKVQYEQFCDETVLAKTKQLHTQIHKVWQDTHLLQTQLTELFQKQNRIQESTDLKQMQMNENETQIETLQGKMKEIEEKEQLAEQRLDEQLSNVEEAIAEAEMRTKENSDQLQQRRHKEQVEVKKLEHPPLGDRENFYVSSKSLGSSAFRNAPPELKSALLAMKHLRTTMLSQSNQSAICPESVIAKALEKCVPAKQLSPERFIQMLRKTAPHLFSNGELRILDFDIALHNFDQEVIKPQAIREACRALRKKCIEKRVSEKTVKEILRKSGSTQIGSFFLRVDLEPIYIDTLLHTLRAYGGTSTENNMGSCRLALFLDPWQTSTVADDIQLCDFFFTNQKRSINSVGQKEFEAKVDKVSEYKQYELEHLFLLFSDSQERIELRMPIKNVKNNPLLLSQLTHQKLVATGGK
ncbi:unnamed protein product [Amoebophrya sp. A120]|nr:unnamed protein product [Amoebophrya sp. A120]|eukprot:GSA120T00023336001.1